MWLKRCLIVVKQSAYDTYQRASGNASAKLAAWWEAQPGRWERLKDRHRVHQATVKHVTEILRAAGVEVEAVSRTKLTQASVRGAGLVIAIGGDGTCLTASKALGADVPLLGVNSDPTQSSDVERMRDGAVRFDERRSTGAICAVRGGDVGPYLAAVFARRLTPSPIARMRVTAGGLELPHALNDVLVADPNPAAVSRYSLRLDPPGAAVATNDSPASSFSYHVRSSGLRVCTATGSTAAMRNASGWLMHPDSRELQWQDREPILDDAPYVAPLGGPLGGRFHGCVPEGHALVLRWNLKRGCVYVDGHHVVQEVSLGEQVRLSADAPPLMLYRRDDGSADAGG